MSSMLADVVSAGTATAARAAGFRLPAGGKTGTTDDFADAWFIGYTPHLLAGVWFGLDRPAPIMRDGFAGVVAVPAWGEFMRAATAGARPDWYAVPPGVERVAICRLSGARATDACRQAAAADTVILAGAIGLPWLPGERALPPLRPGESMVYEDYFPAGSVPTEICPIHNATAGTASISSMGETPMTAIVIDHVLGADGRMHVVVRQRQN
jgi:hypothetical protein